jgi:hypothetical protein
MISSKQKDLLRVFEFECHQKTNYFKTLSTFINVIAQEKIIIPTDVPIVVGLTPDVKKAH